MSLLSSKPALLEDIDSLLAVGQQEAAEAAADGRGGGGGDQDRTRCSAGGFHRAPRSAPLSRASWDEAKHLDVVAAQIYESRVHAEAVLQLRLLQKVPDDEACGAAGRGAASSSSPPPPPPPERKHDFDFLVSLAELPKTSAPGSAEDVRAARGQRSKSDGGIQIDRPMMDIDDLMAVGVGRWASLPGSSRRGLGPPRRESEGSRRRRRSSGKRASAGKRTAAGERPEVAEAEEAAEGAAAAEEEGERQRFLSAAHRCRSLDPWAPAISVAVRQQTAADLVSVVGFDSARSLFAADGSEILPDIDGFIALATNPPALGSSHSVAGKGGACGGRTRKGTVAAAEKRWAASEKPSTG